MFEKKPLKPFLINQATLLLERGQLRIPNRNIDETIHRQMTNYQVVRVSGKTNEPVYTSDDEHALDAMVFALFAFIEEYPDLVNTIYQTEVARSSYLAKAIKKDPLRDIIQGKMERRDVSEEGWDEPGSPPLKKVSIGYAGRKSSQNTLGWGRRGTNLSRKPGKTRRF